MVHQLKGYGNHGNYYKFASNKKITNVGDQQT